MWLHRVSLLEVIVASFSDSTSFTIGSTWRERGSSAEHYSVGLALSSFSTLRPIVNEINAKLIPIYLILRVPMSFSQMPWSLLILWWKVGYFATCKVRFCPLISLSTTFFTSRSVYASSGIQIGALLCLQQRVLLLLMSLRLIPWLLAIPTWGHHRMLL